MPRKSSGSGKAEGVPTSRQAKATWKGFVNYRPSAVDKDRFKSMVDDGYEPFVELDRVLDGGYKLSLSVDRRNEAFVATIYGHDATCVNAGYAVSARAADGIEAIRRVLFLVSHVLPDSWLDAGSSDDEW